MKSISIIKAKPEISTSLMSLSDFVSYLPVRCHQVKVSHLGVATRIQCFHFNSILICEFIVRGSGYRSATLKRIQRYLATLAYDVRNEK